MSFIQQNGMCAYQFELFKDQPVVHGIFTRHGGISDVPFTSLNVGGSIGDPRENVIENSRRIFSFIGRPFETRYDPWQVHGERVIQVTSPRPIDDDFEKADILISDRPEVTLMERFADCVPLLFYDPRKHAIAIAHAGWRGTVKQVATVTVAAMHQAFASKAEDLYVGIGPSIGSDHYQVGDEVIDGIKGAFGDDAQSLLEETAEGVFLDLWETNRLTLQRAGVTHIQVAGICTACNKQDWFSHRAENGKTGRFGVVIALNS